MSKAVHVMIVGEGASEQNFVDQVLAPYLAVKGVYLRATQISKKGEKGGDVKFSRARRDVINFLKQRENLIVSTFVDYYGVKEWPGLENVRGLHEPAPDVIAKVMNDAAVSDIRAELPLLAETEAIAAQVAAVREGGGLEDPAFAFALEASLRALLSPEQCLTLLGAEAFAPVEDTALAPTRRALLSAGTA